MAQTERYVPYFKFILAFSGAVCIYAQRSRELCLSRGCFESGDNHISVTLDGDKVYYVDFKKGEVIWDSRVPTFLHVPWAYKYAIHYQFACKSDLQRWKPDESAATKTKEAPEILIYPRDEVIKEKENILVCFINHFFPPLINIKWTKNDIEVAVEYPVIKCLANHDGTFYVFSYLNFVPQEGDIYSCTVEHESLERPQTMFWEVDTDEISIGPAVFCGLGVSLGLLGFAAGAFFFVKGNQYQGITDAGG
ncbi:H-2 class II histocompatibility antigen, A-Q alpha chain-like isoform X3 [Seriola aureovittata]|uniref:H-2 class II histocompatibility antigen, A-Q alpha chain-like isoform X3 n=1 Tax=Seriola aureovittata TaxID=2871759 RepID=UPI0024BE19BD|nr:H-2 class II histocompatibility antigen, A-Q alpha chain-like isoform X3 [Seriola aureovittata]